MFVSDIEGQKILLEQRFVLWYRNSQNHDEKEDLFFRILIRKLGMWGRLIIMELLLYFIRVKYLLCIKHQHHEIYQYVAIAYDVDMQIYPLLQDLPYPR